MLENYNVVLVFGITCLWQKYFCVGSANEFRLSTNSHAFHLFFFKLFSPTFHAMHMGTKGLNHVVKGNDCTE